VSRESDQYALGCVAYELLTGQRPFTAGDFIAMGFKHATEDPIPPTQLNPNLPAHVEDAVLKALAKQRENRHADVAAFIAALQGVPISQENEPPQEQEEVSEELDPKAVWASIQRHDVPTTWHVLSGNVPGGSFSSGCMGAIMGGTVTFCLVSLVAQLTYGSPFSDSIPSSMGDIGITLVAIGTFVGAIWIKQYELSRVSKLALMPGGLIYFSSPGVPRHIISYKAVEDIRFDSTKNILAVTMTPVCREVPLGGFDEAPHIIAKSVDLAYTNFKTHNNLP
jgi:serine/threonine protein kinase